ncbi:MAG: type II toxin-antitoxin system HicB family antitoxin [Nostoc sp.]
MLTEYIQAALHRANYEILEDGIFYAEVPELQGLYANASTLEACREELKQSLEEWIILGLQLGHNLPELDGISLALKKGYGRRFKQAIALPSLW